jgi:PTS system nitrogen regulatory IIA component
MSNLNPHPAPQLSKLLSNDRILLHVTVKNKDELLNVVANHAAHLCGLTSDVIVNRLVLRERMASTALGFGFALPHARIAELNDICALYVSLSHPIDFESATHHLVDQLVVLLVPTPAINSHLELLAEITQLFSQKSFRQAIKHCQHPNDVIELVDNPVHA